MPHLFHTAPPTNRYYAWFEALHTRVDILLLGPQPEQVFGAVCERMRECLAAVEQLGNRFNPDSELYRAHPDWALHDVTGREDALGRKAEKQMLPMQPGDLYQTFADSSAFERDFGFRPKTSVAEGVKRFAEWFKWYNSQTV